MIIYLKLFGFVSWFKPSQQPIPTQPLAHSPTIRIREKIGKIKDRKLMGSVKGTLIGKAKAAHRSKSKQGIKSLLPTCRQVFSHPPDSRVPSPVMMN